MQIGSTVADTTVFGSFRRPGAKGVEADAGVSATGSGDLASPQAEMSGNRTGLVSQLTAYAIRRTQRNGQSSKGGTPTDGSVQSWARDLTESDRKMLEAMTGYRIGQDGSFTDEDGNSSAIAPSFAAVIASISLARAGQAQGVENLSLDDTITPEQFDDVCSRVQVAMFQAGDIFDNSVRDQGLDYLKNLSDAAETAQTAAQTAAETSAEVEKDNAPTLSLARQHYVQDMVDDPIYAAKAVKQYATTHLAMLVKLPVPANGAQGYVDPKIVQESYDRWMKAYQTVNEVHANAKTLYEQGLAEGKSSTEIYRDILKDQLAQSDAYWQARDPDHLFGNMKESTQAELDALEKAMAAAQAKTANSTKTA